MSVSTSLTTLSHAVNQSSDLFLRESIPLFLQITPQIRKGTVLIDALPHCSAQMISDMLNRVEIWRAGWPLHRLDLLLLHELPDYSSPVGTSVVVLEHCISSHVVHEGDSYWDKNFIDVSTCVQVSIDNDQLCLSCVADLGPHHDAFSVKRHD